MKIKRSPYISDEISKQYPIDELKGLIINVIDIVENFILELGDENKYNSSSTAKYEEIVNFPASEKACSVIPEQAVIFSDIKWVYLPLSL